MADDERTKDNEAEDQDEGRGDQKARADEEQEDSFDEDVGHRSDKPMTSEEDAKEDEMISDSKKCPECDEPIHNVRVTCPNCGYEYKDSDYDDKEAGLEFMAGSEIDESELGEKVTDDTSGKEKTKSSDDRQKSSDDEDEDEDEDEK